MGNNLLLVHMLCIQISHWMLAFISRILVNKLVQRCCEVCARIVQAF